MKLTLVRSGGVAGMRPPPVRIDTAALSADDAARIEELVTACRFFALPSELPERNPMPDAFQYDLTVQTGAQDGHSVTFSEQSASEGLRELKRFISSLARR